MLKTRIIVAFAIIMALSGTPTAFAGVRSDTITTHGVTMYHNLIYATTACGGFTGYKIQSDEYRFYRSTTDRGARVDSHWAAEVLTYKCSGGVESEKLSSGSHDACFGCNGNSSKWSRDYFFSYSFPYVRNNGDSSIVHSKLVFRVYLPYSGGRTYYSGSTCSSLVLIGGNPC